MAQARTVAQPLRLPLHSPLQTRTAIAPLTKDSRLYNGFAEYDPGFNNYQIFKRPGLGPSTFNAVPAGAAGNGLYTETGTSVLYAVFGGALFTGFPVPPAPPTFSPLGIVDNSAPYFFETIGTAGVAGRSVVLGNGAAAYVIVLGTNSGPPAFRPIPASLTQITDPNFPIPFAPGWAFLNGNTFVMDLSGNIIQSAGVNNALVWSALAVIPANNYADVGIALARQLNYVVAFKQYSTQIFYDAGNPPPGSTLSPVPDAQLPYGCLSATSIQSIDNSLLWLTSNQTISPQVVQMENLSPRIVSTPAVDRVLDNITWASSDPNFSNVGVRSWAFKHGGHRFYGLTSIANNFTLVYDLDQALWYFWTDPLGNYWPVVETAFLLPASNVAGTHYIQHAFNGNIYPLDGDYTYPNDFGTLFPVDIYTPNFDGGVNRRKQLNMMYFDTDAADGSILNARFSDDDYESWSNFRNVDLSVPRPKLPNNGTFQFRRAYHFRHLCNTPLRLRAIDLQIDLGTL